MSEQAEAALALLKVLLDEERLRVAGALALAPATIPELAARCALHETATRRHVERLASAGLLERTGEGTQASWRLNDAAIHRHKRALFAGRTPRPPRGSRVERLQRFVSDDGRLQSIPLQPATLQVVLAWLVERFQPGERYPEREVNVRLSDAHDDYATLRRLLVDHGLMRRHAGIYERTDTLEEPS